MYSDYEDIRSRIDEEPRWFDENGVPRYCDPHPDACPSIYANKVVFMRIACQDCEEEFLVEMHTSPMDEMMGKGRWPDTIDGLHYGDPPRHVCHGGRGAGETMNSIPLAVEMFWRRGGILPWERVPELERAIKA